MELLIYISKSFAILALFYFLYFTVLQRDTFFATNRHFLIAGIIASMVFPLLIFTKMIYVEVPEIVSLIPIDGSSINGTLGEANSGITIDWLFIGIAIYFTGVVYMSFRFIKQLHSLLKLLNGFPSEKIGGFTYIRVNKDITPFSFFRFIVYNPDLHQSEDLKLIIKHEQAHASQWHSLDIIFANLLLIVQWINPIAWLYKKSIEENLEFIADSEAAQQLSSKTAYQLTLVKVVSTALQPSLTNNFYQSLIKKRIVMLHKNASKAQNQWKIALILPLLALFLWSFNVKEVVNYKKTSANLMSADVNSDPTEKDTFFENNNALIEAYKNKEDLKVATVSTMDSKKIVDNEITMTIDKNTSDKDLKKIKKVFKDGYGVTVTFSDVNRNSDGEITSIRVEMKSKNASGNFHEENSEGIKSFHIYYNDETDELRMGSSGRHNLHFKSKDGNAFVIDIDKDNDHKKVWTSKDVKVIKKKGSGSIFIHEEDDDGNVKLIERKVKDKDGNVKIYRKKVSGNHVLIETDEDGHGNTFFYDSNDDHKASWISSDGKKIINADHDIFVIEGDDDSSYFFMDKDSEKSLVIIDGKESTLEELKNLKKGTMKTIEVIKGDKAIEEYGKKAKDGVIIVTTKKN